MKRLTVVIITVIFGCLSAASFVTQARSSGSAAAIGPLQDQIRGNAPADLDARIRALRSASVIERASAACQIGEMGKRAAQAIPHLINLLGDDSPITSNIDCGDRSWRGKVGDGEPTTMGRIAAGSLAAIGEQSVEPLNSVVRNTNPIVRLNAVFSLGIIKDPRTLEPVISASRDNDPRVREIAAWGMGLKHDKSVVAPLISALGDGEWKVREKAGWSLGLQGDASAVEPLANALRDENATVRAQVAWALGLKGNRTSVEPLMNALRDSEWRVREKAAWSLGLKGDDRAVESLVAALQDTNSEVRAQTAWALGLKGDHRAVDGLNAAMKDQSSEVRRKATWALGMILLRDGKAAEKASGLDIDLNRNPR